MIFAVFDVLLAVNMCINYSFFYIYINIVVLRLVIILINEKKYLEKMVIALYYEESLKFCNKIFRSNHF